MIMIITLSITFIIVCVTIKIKIIIIIIITIYYFLNNGIYFNVTAVNSIIKFIFERVKEKRTKFHSNILKIGNDF